ncbi:MAG: leucine-rich repeat protein [Victivallales bacterium]|nr:leucine-rich repeat protein [Victivallales bacterium]
MRYSNLLLSLLVSSCCLMPLFAADNEDIGELRTDMAELLQAGFIPHYRRSAPLQTRTDSVTDVLAAGLREHKASIDVSAFSIPVADASKVFSETINDNPDLFFVSNSGYTFVGNVVKAYQPTYIYDAETSASMLQEIEEQAAILLQGTDDCESDIEKIMAVYDALILHTGYGYLSKEPADFSNPAFNIYGALVQRRTVCQGYALAILYLLRDKLGISCGVFTSANANHAWNAVEVNGKWYHLDATSGDPLVGGSDYPGFVDHQYFLRGDEVARTFAVGVYKNSIADAQPPITDFGEAGEDNAEAFWLSEEVLKANRNIVCFGGHAYYLGFGAQGPLRLLRSSFADNSTVTLATLPGEYGRNWGDEKNYLFAASGIARHEGWLLFNTMTAIKGVVIPPIAQTRGEPEELTPVTVQEFDCEANQGYLYGFWKENGTLYAHCSRGRNAAGTVLTMEVDLANVFPVTFTIADGEATVTGLSNPDTTVLEIPGDICGYPVTSIAEEAFADSGLTSVTLPDAVTAIGNAAFRGCASLTEATLPTGLKEIGEESFADSGLTSVTLPDAVTAIGNAAFRGCASLTKVTLPSGLETIGEEAFAGSGVTEVVFEKTRSEESAFVIGKEAFANCASLQKVYLPSNLTELGEGAFAGCTALTDIRLPDTLEHLPNRLFLGCSALTSMLPLDNVKSLGESAFQGCSTLTTLILGPEMESLGDGCFDDCPALTTIYTDNQAIIPRLRELVGYEVAIRPLPEPFLVSIQTDFISGTRSVVYSPELVFGLDSVPSSQPALEEGEYPFSLAFTDSGVFLDSDIRQFAENTTWTITATIPAGSSLTLDWTEAVQSNSSAEDNMPAEFNFTIAQGEEAMDMRETTNLTLDNSAGQEMATFTLQIEVVQKSDAPTLEINLHAGWNLIGIPFELKEESRKELDSYSPMSFDSSIQVYVSAVQNYQVGQGVWLFCQDPATIVLYGRRCANPGINLSRGWNLVTPPYGESGTPSSHPGLAQTWYCENNVFYLLPTNEEAIPACGYLIYTDTPLTIWQ